MDVTGVLQIGQPWRDCSEEIINGDCVSLHHFSGSCVALDNRFGGVLVGDVGNRRCTGPNQLRTRLLHSLDKLFKPSCVIRQRRRTIVNSEIEVDHVPLAVPQPCVNLLQPGRRWTAVGRSTMHVGDSRKFLSDRLRVGA